MSKRFLTLLLVFIFPACVCSAPPYSAKFLPPDDKILLFIGQDRESIDTYSRELNTVPAGVMFYTSVQTLTGITDPIDYGAGFQDASYLLREYPDAAIQIGLYLVGTLPQILDGKYDENINRLGEWLKETRRPVFLRIGYEFDLPQNGYDPDLYKKTFQYLVDHWRVQGVTNVAYVWHSYGVINADKPYQQWYPGDDYVDWFGVSIFSLYNIKDAAVFGRLAREHGKPLMVAEASPNSEIPMDGKKRWERWYQSLFTFVRENDVRAISYINCEWDKFPMWKGQGWGDSRVENDPFLRQSWLHEIEKNDYLRPSSGLFKQLGLQ